MDKKIAAVAVVAILVIAAAAVFVVTRDNSDSDNDSMKIIGRVNTDGSGIYFKSGVDVSEYVTVVNTQPTSGAYLGGNGTWVVFNKSAWAGKVIGDPGNATIQHVQLAEIAETMGLEFSAYTKDTTIRDDTLYFLSGVANYSNFVSTLAITPALLGAINWEPQCSVAEMAGCSIVATTNQMFPGHTCCVVGADNRYVSGHEDETVRFLAAYVESVQKMTSAIAQGSGAEYDEVVKVAMDKVAMGSLNDEQKKEAIQSAFGLVVYKYADTTNASIADPLADLKKDIANLATQFGESKTTNKTFSDLGFRSADDLASAFVESSYIKSAMNYQKQDSYSTANISVSVISGDIHQLAIHYGIAMGIFAEYGINITLLSQANGPAVYTSLHNGEAQFGFIGAPPMTINSMNAGEIKA